MAAVQGLLKKHDAFETDFAAHRDRCTDICKAGEKLIADGNHHSDNIAQRCQQLQVSMSAWCVRTILIHIHNWRQEESQKNG